MRPIVLVPAYGLACFLFGAWVALWAQGCLP